MADELLGAGQVPNPPANDDGDSGTDANAAELARARQEAAARRVELKELKAQMAELAPKAKQFDELNEAQKSESEKLAAQVAQLQAELEAQQRQTALAQARSKLLGMATKAGVSSDLVDLLDLSKFDLDDEEATAKRLATLAGPAQAQTAKHVNPGRTNGAPTDDEMRTQIFGAKSSSIFGGV